MNASGRWAHDDRLLRILDDGLAHARSLAGAYCACRSGCFGCCLGPFPITLQDAARLRRGLEALSHHDPEAARRIEGRAQEAMAALREGFPGDWSTGMLDEPRASEELYAPQYQMIPCPALDLETGACELYEHRPVACRTFGLAVRVEGVNLTPCKLNYVGLSPEDIESRRVDLESEPAEDPLWPSGQTVVAAALDPARAQLLLGR